MYLMMIVVISSVIISVKAVVFVIVDPSHLQNLIVFLFAPRSICYQNFIKVCP